MLYILSSQITIQSPRTDSTNSSHPLFDTHTAHTVITSELNRDMKVQYRTDEITHEYSISLIMALFIFNIYSI